MEKQKMQIIDAQFSEYTGVMFGVPFTRSISDDVIEDRVKARLLATFLSQPVLETTAADIVYDLTLYVTKGWKLAGMKPTDFNLTDVSVLGVDADGDLTATAGGKATGSFMLNGQKYTVLAAVNGADKNGNDVNNHKSAYKVGESVELTQLTTITASNDDLVSIKDGIVTFKAIGDVIISGNDAAGKSFTYEYMISA